MDAAETNHWVLYCGSKGENALLSDGGGPIEPVSFRRLRALWDGSSIVISERPVQIWRIRAATVLELSVYVLSALVFIFVIKSYCKPISRQGRLRRLKSRFAVLATQLTVLTFSAIAIGFTVERLHTRGFLDDEQAVAGIAELHTPDFLAGVSLRELRSITTRGEPVLLVDARWKSDYEEGHIAHAINIEPHATLAECESAMRSIPQSHPIIVYAHVAGCSYSDRIARQLYRLGYQNLRIFRQGWLGWKGAS